MSNIPFVDTDADTDEQTPVERARIFLNGFLDNGRCDTCGVVLEEHTKRTNAGLADVLFCPECGYTEMVELHSPNYDVDTYSR